MVPPFGLDGDPAFSDAELRIIQDIWQRVAEDYAPFDVDVTTEQPSPDRLSRSDVADQTFGMDVLFTLHQDGWLIGNEAGFSSPGAYFRTGSAGDGDKPSFVFYSAGAVDARTLADAATRELGTTLGLRPDVQFCSGDLYGGQGSSPVNGWAPIMGALSERPLRQFDKGEYADPGRNCGEGGQGPQDDFAVIIAAGLPLRADDAGNTAAAATWLPVQSSGGRSAGSLEGVITSAADVDVFSIDAGTGLLDVTADPAPLGPNADLVLTLRDAAGNLVQESRPTPALNAAINVVIAVPGRYSLEVKGGGDGDPLVTGYSNYGSVAAYTLAGSFATPPNTPPTPVLDVSRAIGPDSVTMTFDASRSSDDGNVMRYHWDFGDGTSFDQMSPVPLQKTYPAAVSGNSFAVTLTVTDNTGLTNAVTRNIIPGAAAPMAGFTATALTGRAPLTVSFDPAESSSSEGIAHYAWNFGGPSPEVTNAPASITRTFTSPGDYPVSLLVTDASGRTDTASRTIHVLPALAPVAAFTASSTSVFTTAAVTFNPSASQDDVQIVSYHWDFGDGDVRTVSTPAIVSKAFNTAGTYRVRLQVTDNAGLTHEIHQDIEVKAPVPPVAAFTASQASVVTNTAVIFNPAASQDDVGIVSYRWDFGDGDVRTVSTPAVVSKSFNAAGTYRVHLRVTDTHNLSHETFQDIEVRKPMSGAPVAAFSASPESGDAPLDVMFDPSASYDDEGIVRYDWSFGGGEDGARTDQVPASFSRRFETPGTYQVTLEVTDGDGSTHMTSRIITVREMDVAPQPPVASFTASVTRGFAPLEVTFDPAGSRDDRQIVSYGWSFGDGSGTVTPGPEPVSATFGTAGTYRVRLSVTDGDGLTSHADRLIEVVAAEPPVASFTASVTEGIAPLRVTFDPAASRADRAIASYEWSFGDGSSQRETAPVVVVKSYDRPGSYTVRLTVTDVAGNSTAATRIMSVRPPPTGDGPRVASVEVKLARGGRNRVKGRAVVTVLDAAGKPAVGATVIARWEDPVRAVSSARTRANGIVNLTSPSTAAAGCLRLSIIAVRLGGRLYMAEPQVLGEVCRM